MIVTIIAMKRRGRERNKTQEQVIHNATAHHPLTNVQCLSPGRAQQLLDNFPQFIH